MGISCACGCGIEIEPFDKWGRKKRFTRGHSLSDKGYWRGKKHTDEWKAHMSKIMTGKKFTEERCRNISLSLIGRKLNPESKEKMSFAKRGRYGAAANRWKGDNVGNKQLHTWVRRRFPKPLTCGFCNEKKPLQLANMTGIYNRDLKNYKYLCAKCHVYYDGTVFNLVKGREILHARTRVKKSIV